MLAIGCSVVPGSLDCSLEHGDAWRRSLEHGDAWRHVHCILAVSPATMACHTPALAALLLIAQVEAGRDSTVELWEDPLHPARGWNDVVQP